MVLQVFLGDDAAAEEAYLREDSGMLEGDHTRLHTAHRQAGQRAVRGVGLRAEMLVNEWNDVFDEDAGEADEGGVVHRSAGAVGRGERPRRLAVLHHHDEGEAFAFGEEVVQYPAAASLAAPAGLILGVAVLEIQDGVTDRQVVVVLRRRVNEDVPLAAGDVGMDIELADLAVRDVLQCVYVLVVGRELDLGTLGAGSEKELAGRVRHFGAVYDQGVIMVAFVEGLGGRSRPIALFVLAHREKDAVDLELNLIRLWREYAGADIALRIGHRILLAVLVGREADEVLEDLRAGRKGGQERAGYGQNDSFHFEMLISTDTKVVHFFRNVRINRYLCDKNGCQDEDLYRLPA